MSIKLADLFEEIERRGLSVAQFARQAGIPEDRVYQWKAGRGNPKGGDLVKIQDWVGAGQPDKVLAHDALLTVLLDEVAALKSAATGEHLTSVKMKLQKAAEGVLQLLSGGKA